MSQWEDYALYYLAYCSNCKEILKVFLKDSVIVDYRISHCILYSKVSSGHEKPVIKVIYNLRSKFGSIGKEDKWKFTNDARRTILHSINCDN